MKKQNINIDPETSISWHRKSIKGFTLVEIMIVIVIVGLIASFGIPGFGKMVRKSHERNAILGLTTINQANSIYEAKTGGFYVGGPIDLAAINTNLSIDLKALDFTYSYTGIATSYTAQAVWTDFTVEVDEGPIIVGTNPYCSAGTCPTLP